MAITVRFLAGMIVLANLLPGQADANRGLIIGTISDHQRLPLDGVRIKATHHTTGFVREAASGTDGRYRIGQLEPGSYRIAAEGHGLPAATLEQVVVTVGSATVLDIVLEQQPTWRTGSTLFGAASPAPSFVLRRDAIVTLPLNGRRFQELAVLAPTSQLEPSRQQLSLAGQRGVNGNVMLDGAEYSQPFLGGIRGGERSAFNFTVPQSAIQEFQVITTGYSPEYGRSAGGILNAITKSGGNQMHGDAFYQLRSKEFSHNHPIVHRPPSDSLHQFGFSAGGPVQANRLFWFAAYEQQLSSIPRQVLFTQLANRTPAAATREAFDFLDGEERSFDQTNRAGAFTGRADYGFTGGHRLTLRYNFSDSKEENAVTAGAAVNPVSNSALSNEGTEKDRIHMGTLQFTHLLSPAVIHDLRFSGSFEQRPRQANSESPSVIASPVAIFGARNSLPASQDDQRYQITDGLSMSRGAHTWKAGIDLSRMSAAQMSGLNQFGSFTITAEVTRILTLLSTAPGQNRLDGREVTYSRQIGNMLAKLRVHQLAFYAQDSYRLSSKLTLDYGVRWEGQWNPAVEANNTALVDRLKGFQFPNGAMLDPEKIANRINQWMPRAGFAYVPFRGGRPMVIRGHAGLFYAATPLALFAGPTNNLRNPPGDVSITLTQTATQSVYQQLAAVGVNLNSYPIGALPVIPVETVRRAADLAAGGVARDPFSGIGLSLMAADFENPRAAQTGVGVEREVLAGLVAGLQLNYLNTVHLHRNRDYNVPVPVVRAGDQRPIYGLGTGRQRPISTLGALIVRESSARSMHRSITAQVQYRKRRLQFGGYYTWSQTFSDDDSERDLSTLNYGDPLNFRPDYGFSNLDAKHRAAVHAAVQLPLGFEAASIVRVRSGLPMNARALSDTNSDLNAADRPYSAPGVPFQRNSFRNREVLFNDLRVMKSFRLGEEARRIQFSAEIFNLLDVDNVVYGRTAEIYGPGITSSGAPAPVDPQFQWLKLADGSYNTSNQQVGGPFQVQLGIRFFF